MKALLRSVGGILLALIFVAAGAARGEAGPTVIALLPASGANVDSGTLSAAHEVLRGYLEEAGRFTVKKTSAGTVAEAEPSVHDAVAWAAEVHATQAAVLRLATLGSVMHVRLTVYKVPSGRTVWSDELSAGAAGDIDPVLKRLALAYSTGGRAAQSAQIDTVTEKEAEPLHKITSMRQHGVRLGVLQAFNSGRNPDPDAIGGGLYWLFDARLFFIDISGDYYGGKRIQDLAAGFGAYFPLTRTDVSPYLGAGLKLALVWRGDLGVGFQPYVAAGVILGRLSDVAARAELSWHFDTFDTGGARPSLLVANVGVQF